MRLGSDLFDGPVETPNHRVTQHYLGRPGVGKSALLWQVARQKHEAKDGVLLPDTKDGDLAIKAATLIQGDVIYVAPGMQPGWTLNVLSGPPGVVRDGLIDLFLRTGKMQPNFTQVREHLIMATPLAMTHPNATLQTIKDVLTDDGFRAQLLRNPVHREVRKFWEKIFESRGKAGKLSSVSSTLVILDEFLLGDQTGPFLSSPVSTVNLGEWLDRGALVVLDCASGYPNPVTQLQSEMLANLMVFQLIKLAFARRNPKVHWCLVCDEFDKLASGMFSTAAEKLRASLLTIAVAHQSLSQLSDELRVSLVGAPIRGYFRLYPKDANDVGQVLKDASLGTKLASLRPHTVMVSLPEDEASDYFPDAAEEWIETRTENYFGTPDLSRLSVTMERNHDRPTDQNQTLPQSSGEDRSPSLSPVQDLLPVGSPEADRPAGVRQFTPVRARALLATRSEKPGVGPEDGQ